MEYIRKNFKKIVEKAALSGIWFQTVYVLFILFGITALGVPKASLYIMDIVTVVLGGLSIGRLFQQLKKPVCDISKYIVIFLVYTFTVFLINHQSVLYYLWGLRNTFRFFLFFLVCSCWLRKSDVKGILKIFEILVYLNALVCSVQFWIQKMPFDNICGLFGVTTKGGGYMNVLLVIVTAKVVLQYLNKMISVWHFGLTVGCGVYISAISELKAYYFELAVIVVVALGLSILEKKKINRQKIIVALVCAAGMAVIACITVKLNPEYWQGFFTPQGVISQMSRESGYSAQGDLNRLTAVRDIYNNIFEGDVQSIIGYGLGNCDYASADFLTTPFYRMYENLHYQWIHIAFLFLELGFAGLGLYMLFFFFVGKKAWNNQKTMENEDKVLNQMALILAICCIMLVFYNICLRMESAYMIFFVLSIPYCVFSEKDGE